MVAPQEPACLTTDRRDPTPSRLTRAPQVSGPTLSVIVPVHNDSANLETCVAALRASDLKGFEIIVVDDGSTDDTPAVADRLGVCTLRLPGNLGPSAARNRGAAAATGSILLFVDADVQLQPRALTLLMSAFEENADIDAIFGSYCRHPARRNVVSQYRNLLHHFVHQQAVGDATTFWSGCGAVRREAFESVGGFDESRRAIEDIEFGIRLFKAGRRTVIRPDVQGTHLKRWGIRNTVKTDVLVRGVPWTRLILEHRNLPRKLNLGLSQQVSSLLALLHVVALGFACWHRPWMLTLPLATLAGVVFADRWRDWRRSASWTKHSALALIGAAVGGWFWYGDIWAAAVAAPLAGIVLLNRRLYLFFIRERSILFTLVVMPLHVAYYLYSLAAFAIGVMAHLLGTRPRPQSASKLAFPGQAPTSGRADA